MYQSYLLTPPYPTYYLITRQATYVQLIIEVLSCNYCFCGKAVSFTQPVCVFVAVVIQQAMRVDRIVTCGLPRSAKVFHIIS